MEENKVKVSLDVVNTDMGLGIQEFEYMKKQLEPEILAILPDDDWIKDKSSQTYIKFQHLLLFNIAISDRAKQHLDKISKLMETPYELLLAKCSQEL